MPSQKRQFGDQGEAAAVNYLKDKGYKIIDRNYSRPKFGEIDIVAAKMEGRIFAKTAVLVFVEVKTRYSLDFGPPVESMTPWKIKALLKTARFYVQKIGWGHKEYRLDFIGLDFADSQDNPKIELIKNITS